MDNEESVANVLNALAGKLTYSNYTEGERNLTGYAKIADGLTASSQTLKSDTIKFNKDTGKGGTKEDGSGPDEGDTKNISPILSAVRNRVHIVAYSKTTAPMYY